MAARSKRTTGKAVASRKKKAGAATERPEPRWGRNDTGLDGKKPTKKAKVTAKKALSKARKSSRAKTP